LFEKKLGNIRVVAGRREGEWRRLLYWRETGKKKGEKKSSGEKMRLSKRDLWKIVSRMRR